MVVVTLIVSSDMYRLLRAPKNQLEYLSDEDSQHSLTITTIQDEHQTENTNFGNQNNDGENTVQPRTDDTGDVLQLSDDNGHGESQQGRSEGMGKSSGSTARNAFMEILGYGHVLHATLEERHKFLADRLYSNVRKRVRTSKYLSRVCWTRDNNFHQQLCHLIKSRATTVLFKWLTVHNNHYHIVHDCTYSNGTCRCFNKFEFTGRNSRVVATQDLSLEDIEFIIKYHFSRERRVEVLEIGGADYAGLFHRHKDVQPTFDTTGEDKFTGDVEICTQESEILWKSINGLDNLSANGEGNPSNGEDGPTTSRQSRKRRTPQEEKENVQEQLERIIMAICKYPIHDFVTTDKFLSSKWRFYNNMSTSFKNAISTVKLKFLNMDLCDYKRFYEQLDEMPYWDTNSRSDFDKKYMDIELSKRIVLKLLIWQYADTSIDHKTFNVINNEWKCKVFAYIRDLIMLIDKKRHKLNTDVYLSPPNAGKTLFCDMLRDYLINCGQMSHWNRNSNFPLQTCGYTRLIFWNEPNYESSVERNLLKLLGGDSYNASIKNQMDINIAKTPFIVTSNNDPFPHKPEFEYRCKYHYWKSFDMLKVVNGRKFHPLTFQFLIDQCENYYEEDITGYLSNQKVFTNEDDDNFLIRSRVNNSVELSTTDNLSEHNID